MKSFAENFTRHGTRAHTKKKQHISPTNIANSSPAWVFPTCLFLASWLVSLAAALPSDIKDERAALSAKLKQILNLLSFIYLLEMKEFP